MEKVEKPFFGALPGTSCTNYTEFIRKLPSKYIGCGFRFWLEEMVPRTKCTIL
jgi:hypothetical protein